MNFSFITLISMLLTCIISAVETNLYYYSADNKTAKFVIDAIETKRFPYDEVEAKLETLIKSRKLTLRYKTTLSEHESLYTVADEPIQVEGETVAMGIEMRAANSHVLGFNSYRISFSHRVPSKRDRYTIKQANVNGLLPAKSWQIVAKWVNEEDTQIILIQTPTTEIKKASEVSRKKTSYSCDYQLVEVDESYIRKFQKASEKGDSKIKATALNTIIDRSDLIHKASVTNRSGYSSLLSDHLEWAKDYESAQLGLMIEQKIEDPKKQKSKIKINSKVSWSERKKFNKKPAYEFNHMLDIEAGETLLLLPTKKPERKARSLALIVTIKKIN